MNYNEHNNVSDEFIVYTDQHPKEGYDNSQQNKGQDKIADKWNKQNYGNSAKPVFAKGKQNESYSNKILTKNGQGMATNHSFNGLFNQNRSQLKGSKKQQKKQIEFFDASNNNILTKNKTSNSSAFSNMSQLSNYQFINDSSKYIQQVQMHPQTKKFIMKYFSDNFNSNDFYRQYITLVDFVDILFEQYQNVIGDGHNSNIFDEFTHKIFLIFGEQVYFEDLFQKTLQNGLVGLILEAFKAIQQDQSQRKNSKFPNQMKQKKLINESKSFLAPSNKNKNNFNNQQKNQILSRLTVDNSLNSQQLKNPITKISLDQYFSNQNSKMVIFDNSSQINQEDLQDVKGLLSDYIQQMYEVAEKKINKKYLQEYKKVSLKYRDTQKLLQKINEKISTHYDTLSTIKQYEKKVKIMKEKQVQLEKKVKTLQSQNKLSKDQVEKGKQNSLKLEQQIDKLNKKMEKYENAFFQKAMQKDNSFNNHSARQVGTNLNISTVQAGNIKPKLEFKIDNYTEHLPILAPIQNPIRSYSPYIPRQLVYPTTPKQSKQAQRVSVSPIRQRISFNNPQTIPANPNLQISTVQRVQIGDVINLRPTSPIGKLQPLGVEIINSKIHQNSNNIFTTSRISTVSPIRR